jgi:hypothetical protein
LVNANYLAGQPVASIQTHPKGFVKEEKKKIIKIIEMNL